MQKLFLLAGTEGRLPARSLLAWRSGNCLDLLFLGFLRLPITLLLFAHAGLLKFDDDDDDAVVGCDDRMQYLDESDARAVSRHACRRLSINCDRPVRFSEPGLYICPSRARKPEPGGPSSAIRGPRI